MEVIKKRRGRPPKIKTEGKGNLVIKIKHSQDSDSDSDNDYNDGCDGKGEGGNLEKLKKDSASTFVEREKKATAKTVGGKIYKISEAQIKLMLK